MLQKHKLTLLCGGAVIAISCNFAVAQESEPSDTTAESQAVTDTIVVTGTRSQLRDAINQKRELDRIADVVAEDDVGNLPDFNAAEALSRIPGVAIAQDQAEGRFVTIRGLNSNFNQTTVDGAEVSSTDIDGRRIEMDVVPASLAGSIQVIKSLTPDMDAAAIGGTINFVSRSPFDYDDGFLAFTGSVGQFENNDGYNGDNKWSGNADVVYSRIFGKSDEFGLVLSGNYYKRDSYLGRIEQGDEILFHEVVGSPISSRSDRVDPYTSDIYIPEEWKGLLYHNNRQRYGGSFKFEHRPSDRARTWVRGYYNRADDSEARMETKMWNRQSSAVLTYDTPTTGLIEDTEWTTQLGRFDFERQTYGLKLAGEYEFGDNFFFTPTLNYSGSTYEQPQRWTRFKQASADFTFDTSSRITDWTPASGDAFDASLFDFEKLELNTDGLDEDIYSVGADLGWNDQGDDVGLGWKTGFRVQEKNKVYDYERTEYRFDGGETLADVGWSRSCPSSMPSCTDNMFISMDPGSIDRLTASILDLPTTSIRENEDDDALRDYDATETVSALYGLVRHVGDRHTFIGGLRYEDTDFESSGFRRDRDPSPDEYVPTRNENGYDNLLASANLQYDISDDLLLRAAFAQSVSRPRMSWQAARGESQDFNGSELSISRGNPNLRPREADNFDLSLEWYMDEGSLLSVGLFHKIIDNQIFRTTRDDQVLFDQDGDGTEELTDARIREYINGDEVKLTGIELGLTKELDNLLPGLGFNVNATILESDFEFELEDGNIREPETFIQQADFTANAVVYYQRGGFEGRLAVNHTGLKLNNLFASNINDAYRDQYDEERTQVDAQLRYDVNEKFSVYSNIFNLLEEEQYEVFGRDQEFTRWESDFGRAIFVGFSYRR